MNVIDKQASFEIVHGRKDRLMGLKREPDKKTQNLFAMVPIHKEHL